MRSADGDQPSRPDRRRHGRRDQRAGARLGTAGGPAALPRAGGQGRIPARSVSPDGRARVLRLLLSRGDGRHRQRLPRACSGVGAAGLGLPTAIGLHEPARSDYPPPPPPLRTPPTPRPPPLPPHSPRPPSPPP